MFPSHVRLFWRHIRRQPSFAFINIFGLATGMAACLLILLFIQRELSFEEMHDDADRIVRLLTVDKALGTNNQRVGMTQPAVGANVADAFSEIEEALRLSFGQRLLLRFDDETPVYAEEIRSADPNFFSFFDFQLLRGDPETALREPYSIILTESLAETIFQDRDPMGQVLTDGTGNDLTVTGVLADLPANTHLTFDALGPLETLRAIAQSNQPQGATGPVWVDSWNMVAMPTYAKFVPGASLEGRDEQLTQFVHDHGVAENFELTIQPLEDVHLGSTDIIFDPVQNKGDRNTVVIFAAIALLILLIAVVNYLNLSTARSTDRAREVGMRKVVGSTESQLIKQFLSESVMTAFVALLLALAMARLALPTLNSIADTELTFISGNTGLLVVSGLSLVLVAGFLAGLYPAFALSKFKPISVLKGSFRTSRSGRTVRVGLVVFQFTLSIALIGTTGMVQKQLEFIQERDMGYDREQVLLFDMVDGSMAQNQESFREELEVHSAFTSVATSGNVPGRTFGRTGLSPEGASEDDIWIWSVMNVAPGTLPALGIEMADGRNFDEDRTTDQSGVVLINETAVEQLGWDNPLQRRIFFGEQDSVGSQVIGVVDDFHFAGIHQNIEPLVITPLGSNSGGTVVARVEPGRIGDAVAAAEAAWRSVYPDYPFTYSFLDEEFQAIYEQEQVTGRIVNIFSALAILIACLGLFGLARYSTAQRIKEIGVRKALGASSESVMKLLVLDFAKWVVIANVFAWPLAWMASSQWLESFAYRVEVDWLLLVGASVAAFLIAVVTVMIQSWTAARMNPAVALKHA